MQAEIVSVGTELLMGQIVNTNAQYISKALTRLGVDVHYISTVGDNPGRMEQVIRTALSRNDIVITTGGLGPTEDDITKEVVAQAMGAEMVLHQDILDGLVARFGGNMPPNNARQAYFPVGCQIMANSRGTAPGYILEKDGKAAIVLPGPPYELNLMFDTYAIPFLKSKSEDEMVSHFIRVFGIGESKLEDMLSDLIHNQTSPTLATYCSAGEVQLRLTAKCKTEEEAEAQIAPVEREVCRRLGNHIYTIGSDNLPTTVGKTLLQKGKTLAIAESCTGGLVTSMFVDLPGSSGFLKEGVISYSNEAKERLLHVPQEMLKAHGAVSEEVARAMAIGVRHNADSDYGIATTGIAGPSGGTPEKPVGTVYIAVSGREKETVNLYRFVGERSNIRQRAALTAINLLRLFIEENS